MRDPTEIVRPQQKQEAKFMCSSCGADRGCNCNAPAVKKLAEKMEQDRQRAQRYRERKSQENHVTEVVEPTKPQGEPMQTEQVATNKPEDEGKILNKLTTEIIEIGYHALAERFQYDPKTMTRLARARNELRTIQWM